MKQPDPEINLISIIIPTLDEQEAITESLGRLSEIPGTESIVVDGGSTDATLQAASSFGVRILRTPVGRARQMNAGAAAAGGDILLFLHADTKLPYGFADSVRHVLSDPDVAAGAFKLKIAAAGLKFRIVEWLVYCRSILSRMPYGDQALFLTAETFQAVGGFPDLPIMEDFEFVRRLRRKGRIRTVPQEATTSARRWQRVGVFKTTLVNRIIILGFRLGIDPERLAAWYRKTGARKGDKKPEVQDGKQGEQRM